MAIQYLTQNVYDAAMERIEFLFQEFDNIELSFSGGKDSGVLLNMVFKYMREHNVQRKVCVQYMDYEGSYQYTEDFIRRMVEVNADLIELYWNCLTYKTKCGVSIYRNYWLPWNPEERDIWVRDYPKLGKGLQVYTEENHPYDFYFRGIEDTDFDLKFSDWLHRTKKAKRTVNVLGIRAQESVHRWRAVASDRAYSKAWEAE